MILLIDTSTNVLQLALANRDSGILDEVEVAASPDERGVHDARLATEVDALLKEHAIVIKDISRIGIIVGPGSFTGLRIGLAFVKGLALANPVQVVPITTHEVLSCALAGKDVEVIAIPAYQPQLVYLSERTSPGAIRLAEVGELEGKSVAGTVEASTRIPENARFTRVAFEMKHMLGIAVNHEATGDLETLEPLYVTDFLPGKRTT